MLGPLLKDIDNWLWRRGISHPVIMPLVRNLILFTGICLVMGGVGYAHMPGLFWFGVGAAMITWTFWGLARFFLRQPLGEYSTAFLRVALGRHTGRTGRGDRGGPCCVPRAASGPLCGVGRRHGIGAHYLRVGKPRGRKALAPDFSP